MNSRVWELARRLQERGDDLGQVEIHVLVIDQQRSVVASPAVACQRGAAFLVADPTSQLRERHDATDFETKTQDKLAPMGGG